MTASLIGTTTKPYDTTTVASLGSGNYQLSGVLGNDGVTLNNPGTGSYTSANVGNGITVSVSGLSLVGNGLGNYILGNANNSVSGNIGTITPATVTASLSGNVSKQYNGDPIAAISPANYVLNGVLGLDLGNVMLNNPVTGSYDNANAGSRKKVTVDGLSLNGSAAGNYQLSSTSINDVIGTITQAPLNAALTGSVSKQYNGDAVAKISPANYVLNGVLGLDLGNVMLNNPVTGIYDNANAGAGINVTVSGLALTGSAANNYQLASTTINAPIGSITALPPPPPPPPPSTLGTGNGLAITGVINTPDFRRMVQAAVPPPPPPAAAGPAGPAIGGSFGSAGPSSGGGGFSQSPGEAVAGGPASAPAPQEGSGQSGAGASDPNSPPPSQNGAPVADNGSAPTPNGSAPAANGAPVAANGSTAGGASGASAGTGGAAGASHAGGGAGTSSGSGSPGQTPVHLPASVAVTSRLNSPVSVGNSAAAAFNRLNPSISAGEGISEESSTSGGATQSQGSSQVNQSRASRFGGVGSDSTAVGDLNSMVQVLAL